MKEVSKLEFDAVVEQVQAECTEMNAIGMSKMSVTTKEYAPLTGGGATLVEYFAAVTMFGFVQNGRYFTNGV